MTILEQIPKIDDKMNAEFMKRLQNLTDEEFFVIYKLEQEHQRIIHQINADLVAKLSLERDDVSDLFKD